MNDRQASDTGPEGGGLEPLWEPGDLAEVASELTRQADRLRAEIAAAAETDALLRADCDLDAADAGAKIVSLQQLRTRTGGARALLKQILVALDRLREGTFGTGTACGLPIGRERAMALPHTELCVACRQQRDSRRLREAAEGTSWTPDRLAADRVPPGTFPGSGIPCASLPYSCGSPRRAAARGI
jgi:DnaK suppressor protein